MAKAKKTKKKNSLKDWFDVIENIQPTGHTKIFKNSLCDFCKTLEEEMIRVGCIVCCKCCFAENFKTKDPVVEEPELYKKLAKEYLY